MDPLRDNTQSPEAKAHDQSMGLPLLPVDKIHSDSTFNCRGPIPSMDVLPLVKDLQKDGLICPIIVRPRLERTPPQFDYVLVAGHRRHRAYQVMNCPVIPAIVNVDLDEWAARSLNLKENIQRQDLNMLQEARALSPYFNAGWTLQQISEDLKKPIGWVALRKKILSLPEDVQYEIASGLFNQQHIDQLSRIKDKDKLAEVIKKIKDRKDKTEKIYIPVEEKPKSAFSKKVRDRNEITKILDMLMTDLDPSFATRCLAWCAGNIDNLDFHRDIQAEYKKVGKTYELPKFKET